MPGNTINEISDPLRQLNELAKNWKLDIFSEEFSKELDSKNLWPHYRNKFYYPKLKDLPKGKIFLSIYFLKNQLTLSCLLLSISS